MIRPPPRLRGYREYRDSDGKLLARAPLLDRTYRPTGWHLIAALIMWAIMIGLVTWWARS